MPPVQKFLNYCCSGKVFRRQKKGYIGSKQKNGFFFFVFVFFKTKKPLILILHLPMTKAGQRKEKDRFAFDQFDEKKRKIKVVSKRLKLFLVK